MRCYKIAILVLSLMLTLSNARAEDASTAVLAERAHYWEKLGRPEMALASWQALLQIAPANAEALAALSKSVIPEQTVSTPISPVAPPLETTIKPAAEPAITSNAIESQAPMDAPAITPAIPTQTANNNVQPPVKKVEDWPDLYRSGIVENALPEQPPVQADAPKPIAAPVAPAPSNDGLKTPPADDRKVRAGPVVTPDAQQIAGVREENVNGFMQRQMNAAPPAGLLNDTPLPGGALTADDSPAELAARAAYWDSHGRRDLADKIRRQSTPAIVSPVVRDTPLPAPAANPVIAAAVLKPVAGNIEAPTSVPPVQVYRDTQVVVKPPVVQDSKLPDKPDTEEMARYWEARGRSDLAGEVRSQGAPKPKAVVPFAVPSVVQSSYPATEAQPATALKPDTETMARYWDAHGRSDLADQLRNQGKPVVQAGRIAAPSRVSVPDVPVDAQLGAQQSKQSRDDKAQYWEAHGRSDLATQLRQQLNRSEQAGNKPVRFTPPAQDANVAVERSALEDSLLKNPGSLKTRLDLAQVYRGAGENAKARMLIDSVLADSPDLPEAIFASAQLYAQQRLWRETLAVLEKISPVSRTEEMGRLQKTAWAHVQIDRADALVRQGKNQEAEVLLRRVAAELAAHDNQDVQPEPPPLWNSAMPARRKAKH